MIVVKLCGGLGNQFFQYATARSLAMSTQGELVLDLDWYENTPRSNTPRQYELSRYPIAARMPTAAEQRAFGAYSHPLRRRIPWLARKWHLRRERSFDHDPAVCGLSGDVYLDGYWQSPKYFEVIADTIRSELTPTTGMALRDEEVRCQIESTDAVSVHVRRGDYVSQRAAASEHGTCSLAYYAAALELLARSVEHPHFFVFSDDAAWTRQNLSFPGPATFVEHNGAATAFQDLRLMSLCDHHIIANSSFSWWGAWLNPSPTKRVVAPRHWFADQRPTASLLPADWVRL